MHCPQIKANGLGLFIIILFMLILSPNMLEPGGGAGGGGTTCSSDINSCRSEPLWGQLMESSKGSA